MKYEVKIRLNASYTKDYFSFLITAPNELEAYKMALEEMFNHQSDYYRYNYTDKVEMKIKTFDMELPEKKSKQEVVLK